MNSYATSFNRSTASALLSRIRSPSSVRIVKDGVPLAGLINHWHPHCASRQARLDEELALEELVVFAVSLAVRRQVPLIDLAPVIEIAARADRAVHMVVHCSMTWSLLFVIGMISGSATSTMHSDACVRKDDPGGKRRGRIARNERGRRGR